MSSNLAIEGAINAAMTKLGYCSIKEKQKEAIVDFMNGNDCFVILPSGYGKSLCYGILPYVFDALRGKEGSIVLCVSTFVSLMIDQRDKFSHMGLSAEL